MFRNQLSFMAVLRASLMAAACIFCLSGVTAAAQSNSESAAVEKAFQKYAEDWGAGKIDDVASFLADDVVQMPPDAKAIVGKAALVSDWRKFMAEYNDEWKPTVTEVVVSGNVAYVKGHFTEKRTPKAGGPTQSMSGDSFWVMRRDQSGQWKLVLEMWFGKGWQ